EDAREVVRDLAEVVARGDERDALGRSTAVHDVRRDVATERVPDDALGGPDGLDDGSERLDHRGERPLARTEHARPGPPGPRGRERDDPAPAFEERGDERAELAAPPAPAVHEVDDGTLAPRLDHGLATARGRDAEHLAGLGAEVLASA